MLNVKISRYSLSDEYIYIYIHNVHYVYVRIDFRISVK